ncbi:OCIA domain-containing protein 1 [Sarcophilus harrisii]|uniref:OCIA domain-containing protein 1 n=1 Tax=Sarcophilus harrisii TaxID=9305 RepID=G3X141_SARHA|nr:OCIA domain-containing protein 1 [Sarcophilus harrisii]
MNGRTDFGTEQNAEVSPPLPNIGMDYIPTEEERKVFAECNRESFWYRSVPFSATSVLVTQGLITKGILSSHPKYGSIPKIAFACIMGYFAGKISYVKTCQEKFKRLENSPLGEVLRMGPARRFASPGYFSQKSEFDSKMPPQSSFGTSPTSESSAKESAFPPYEPVPFSASMNESSPTGITDYNAQGPDTIVEESPKRKVVTYEELRNKNRETYEVTLSQKGDTPLRSVQERAPKKQGKVNQYGDTWDE